FLFLKMKDVDGLNNFDRRISSANGYLIRQPAVKIKMSENDMDNRKRKKRRLFHPKSIRAIRLISTTIIFLFFGAFVFSSLEYEADEKLREEIKEIREEMQIKYNFTEE